MYSILTILLVILPLAIIGMHLPGGTAGPEDIILAMVLGSSC